MSAAAAAPRTGREAIEAELGSLRSIRSGFVRSESLRLSVRGDDDGERVPRVRRRRGCDEGVKGLIEQIREAMRGGARAGASESPPVARGRGWWRRFDSNNEAEAEAAGRRKGPRDARARTSRRRSLLVDFPKKIEPHRPPPLYDRLLEKIEGFDEADAAVPPPGRGGSQESPLARWWGNLFRAETDPVEGDGTPGQATTAPTAPSVADVRQIEERNNRPVIKKELDDRERRKRVQAATTAAAVTVSASGLGAVAALIFL